jgi:hypothetical protein
VSTGRSDKCVMQVLELPYRPNNLHWNTD